MHLQKTHLGYFCLTIFEEDRSFNLSIQDFIMRNSQIQLPIFEAIRFNVVY